MRLPSRYLRDIPVVVAIVLGYLLSSVTVLEVSMTSAAQARTNVTITGEVDSAINHADFITNLMKKFSANEAGCLEPEGPTGLYQWTIAGYGSNINRFMVHWLRSVVHGQNDMAIINAYNRIGAFFYVRCLEESGGLVADRGWSCIFEDMPHLCPFSEEKEWLHLMMSRGVSYKKRQAAKVDQSYQYILQIVGEIEEALDGSGVDMIAAMSVLLDYLHSHRQPWLKRGIELVLEEPEIASVLEEAYVGMHVRRGDKLLHEARRHEVEEYLSRAASALRQGVTGNGTSSDDIKGIWVSSDDPTVLSEVKQLAADFFPNVGQANIVWISSRTVNAVPHHRYDIPTVTFELPHPHKEKCFTRLVRNPVVSPHPCDRQTYDSFVTWFAELHMLANSDVFVGTFSSNVSRMMLLMREANRLPRNTTISVDRPEWSPGRRLDRRR